MNKTIELDGDTWEILPPHKCGCYRALKKVDKEVCPLEKKLSDMNFGSLSKFDKENIKIACKWLVDELAKYVRGGPDDYHRGFDDCVTIAKRLIGRS